MRKIYTLPAAAILAGAAVAVAFSHTARSADHLDSPAVVNSPTADITDIFAWTAAAGDGGAPSNVVLAMNTNPAATKTTLFDDTVQYVLHTASGSFSATSLPSNTVDIIATFDTATPQNISLWVGTAEYLHGNASDASKPLKSADGKVTVFAGPRADPFFFNLDGFHNTQALVESVAGSLSFNEAGCPLGLADSGASALIVKTLKSGADGGAATNFFATLDELAIVIELDKSLITAGGADVSVWGATYQ